MDRKEFKNIIDVILKTIDVDKIYIFGSYARKTETKDSDVDMYVIVKKAESINTRQKYNNVIFLVKEKLFRNNIYPKGGLDLLLNDNEDFNNKKNQNGFIEYIVNKEGVLIYG